MENKINIAELLKDCPKGMELDCTMYENCTFEGIEDVGYTEILVKIPNRQIRLTKEGCFTHNDKYAKCVIFPKGKTTWEGFQRPFKDGDIIYTKIYKYEWISIFEKFEDNKCKCHIDYDTDLNTYYSKVGGEKSPLCEISEPTEQRLATKEEKQKLFQAIKDNGYVWNPETKTMEKLPKFKIGDRIKKVKGYISGIITNISDDGSYTVEYQGGGISFVSLAYQDEWELVSNKFDITTLKPFNKVLIRDRDTDEWNCNLFSYYRKNSDRPYVCIGYDGMNEYEQCIPYGENKHLLGTTNDCDEFYKAWEE